MPHRIEYTPLALDQLCDLARHERRTVLDEVDKHLTHEPEKESKSRINRLRGYSVPAYRLRIGDLRVLHHRTPNSNDPRHRAEGSIKTNGSSPTEHHENRHHQRSQRSFACAHERRGPVLVTRHGKPAGVIIGFPTEADYLDWKIENDPRIRAMMEKSLAQKAAGEICRCC